MLIIAPSSPQTGVACGAAASHSLSAPHSSTSKWLQLIQRSCAGSISFATASRTSGNIPRMPVWNSSGSSSLIEEVIELKVEVRDVHRDAIQIRGDFVDACGHGVLLVFDRKCREMAPRYTGDEDGIGIRDQGSAIRDSPDAPKLAEVDGAKAGTRDSGRACRAEGRGARRSGGGGSGIRDSPATPKLAEVDGAKAGETGNWILETGNWKLARARHSFSRNFRISRMRNFWKVASRMKSP